MNGPPLLSHLLLSKYRCIRIQVLQCAWKHPFTFLSPHKELRNDTRFILDFRFFCGSLISPLKPNSLTSWIARVIHLTFECTSRWLVHSKSKDFISHIQSRLSIRQGSSSTDILELISHNPSVAQLSSSNEPQNRARNTNLASLNQLKLVATYWIHLQRITAECLIPKARTAHWTHTLLI